MMALLTRPVKYDINDSNIALLGSDLEKRVREHAGDKEQAWTQAGLTPGLQVWRIEQFKVLPVPAETIGSFYDGDSYIVLHTYRKDPKSNSSLSYDLHFWLGRDTTQDEAGTAAYKTVELDDHLHGLPVQYREIQGSESQRFLSYFPHFVCLHGGVSTGFHHVSTPPPPDIHKLYRISVIPDHSRLIVREVPPEAGSLAEGDVFVLDKGSQLWQFNTQTCVGREKFAACQFVENTATQRRQDHCQVNVTVYDEGGHGAGLFLAEFGISSLSQDTPKTKSTVLPKLFRLSDVSGVLIFEAVHPPPRYSSLSSVDAFLLDDTHSASPAVYVWLGKESSLNERRLAVQYAQKYLHGLQESQGGLIPLTTSIVKMAEGRENEAFLRALSE